MRDPIVFNGGHAGRGDLLTAPAEHIATDCGPEDYALASRSTLKYGRKHGAAPSSGATPSDPAQLFWHLGWMTLGDEAPFSKR
jgi:hypothetical protein